MTDFKEHYEDRKSHYIEKYGAKIAAEIMVKTVLHPSSINKSLTYEETTTMISDILAAHGVAK